MNETWLAHHGVKGMKWGVRRYQNADGSYTKRGLEHYKDTEKRYDEADQTYKSVKKLYKYTKKYGSVETSDGQRIAVTKDAVKEAKELRKQAKKDLSANYDQLKNDYVADKGKKLYRSGKTITGNAHNLYLAGLIASGTAASAAYLHENGNDQAAGYAAAAGAGMEFVNGIFAIKNGIQARQLRAYYGHSAKYV